MKYYSSNFVIKKDMVFAFFLFIFFAFLMVLNAWIVDDAYITFRSVDNFLNGYGLKWNVDERVQVYTHPLWMFVVSFFVFLTSEFFFTVLILSGVLSFFATVIAYFIVINKTKDFLWKGYLILLSLMASNAFFDYASSGLENSLSYLIAAIFLYYFLDYTNSENNFENSIFVEKSIFVLFFLASLAFMNRVDTILIYIPPLIYIICFSRIQSYLNIIKIVMLSTIPATGWLLFSLVYYGYPFPNTAYAKALHAEYPFDWKIQRGLEYLTNSATWDVASWLILACALFLIIKNRLYAHLSLYAGMLFYLFYVGISAASATHMSGRFLALPFFVATILFVDSLSSRRFADFVCLFLVLYIAVSPVSAVKFGTPLYTPYSYNINTIDTKWFALKEGAALLNWRPGKKMPDHEWYHYGEFLRFRPERVIVGGAFGGYAIGFAGFAVGPEKHIVDIVALSDPLLSKLPPYRPDDTKEWVSGHFPRHIPEGYLESLETGDNLVQDLRIREYYDQVLIITRSPIFSWKRMSVIAKMNLGKFDHLLRKPRQLNESQEI